MYSLCRNCDQRINVNLPIIFCFLFYFHSAGLCQQVGSGGYMPDKAVANSGNNPSNTQQGLVLLNIFIIILSFVLLILLKSHQFCFVLVNVINKSVFWSNKVDSNLKQNWNKSKQNWNKSKQNWNKSKQNSTKFYPKIEIKF